MLIAWPTIGLRSVNFLFLRVFKPLNKNIGGVPPGFTDLRLKQKIFTDLSSGKIYGLARRRRKKIESEAPQARFLRSYSNIWNGISNIFRTLRSRSFGTHAALGNLVSENVTLVFVRTLKLIRRKWKSERSLHNSPSDKLGNQFYITSPRREHFPVVRFPANKRRGISTL